jgi:hypothetical protein
MWHFFETFVGAQNHWLPPDNFQETPWPVVAHRSSPTNFGLYLLSILAARDFGWIGATHMVERLEARWKRWKGWRVTGATSTTGTTQSNCARSIRFTSRRWTAAISPVPCWC